MTFTPAQALASIILGIVCGTAVFFHAEKNHIKHPSGWASFVLLAVIIGLPAYIVHVRRVRRRRSLKL